jgi:hypothetical protein
MPATGNRGQTPTPLLDLEENTYLQFLRFAIGSFMSTDGMFSFETLHLHPDVNELHPI